jgi:hypothetical protein
MAFSLTSRSLSLTLAGLALAATACADVGSSNSSDDEFPVPKSSDQDVIVCNSIRHTMQVDKKAADEAAAKGDKVLAAAKNEAVLAGAEGAKSVQNCDVSDLVPAVTPSPS